MHRKKRTEKEKQAHPAKIRRGDIAVALFSLVLAAVLWLSFPTSGGDLTAVVYQNGKEVKRIALNGIESPVAFELSGVYHNHIVAENGRIRFDASDCPDKTCVHTGWLTRAGQSAACLPNKALITVEGARSGGVDAIAE
jgi:hypothetical protein